MARVVGISDMLSALRGQIGKKIVIKQYAHGTVISKYPDMSRVKRTRKQKQHNKKFKEAVAYAKWVMADPQKVAFVKKKLMKGQTVYNYAVGEFLRGNLGC